jgi:uroporphyrinogen decarboxylase
VQQAKAVTPHVARALRRAGSLVDRARVRRFVEDVARAGADGFIFEPVTSLETIVERYGKTHVIVGNVDCRILTYGSRDEIRAEVERCARLGRDCPGYFLAVGNHIPVEVPVDNLLYYFDLCQEMGRR